MLHSRYPSRSAASLALPSKGSLSLSILLCHKLRTANCDCKISTSLFSDATWQMRVLLDISGGWHAVQKYFCQRNLIDWRACLAVACTITSTVHQYYVDYRYPLHRLYLLSVTAQIEWVNCVFDKNCGWSDKYSVQLHTLHECQPPIRCLPSSIRL
jgi:hypothetical protein